MTRIVIDTNLYVSALINENSRQRLNIVIENTFVEILIDATLFAELYEVINRPKFSKYLTKSQIGTFLELLNERCTFIHTISKVMVSPDPKDDFLLALCRDGSSDYLLTGNKLDLLALKQFESTTILSLTEFLNLDFPGSGNSSIPTE